MATATTMMKRSLLARSTTAAILGACAALPSQWATAGSLALEEVIVTATKNMQTVNDVGIAMTAMTGDQLKEMGVSTVNDLQTFNPNLSIKNEFGGNQAVFDIRGVALNSYDTANSSPVATYFDEVAAPYPVMTQGQIFDIERVEVLRGPQGTLFGKNTTGGAVSFYSAKPTEEIQGSLTAEVGNYELTKVEGFISGPITDNFGARLAFTDTKRDEGWMKNVSNGEKYGEKDSTAARLTLQFRPTDELVADLIISYSQDESDMVPTTNLGDVVLPYGSFGWGGSDIVVPASTDPRETNSNINGDASGLGYAGGPLLSRDRPSSDNKGNSAILKVEWEGDDYALSSVTSNSGFDRNDVSDWDGTVYRVQDTEYVSDIKAFSQELRLSYIGGDDLSWILGGYFAKDEVDEFFRSDCSESPTICFMTAFDTSFEQEAETSAIFSHTEYDFKDDLKLTVGLRYTNEKRELIDAKTTVPAGYFAFGLGYTDPNQSVTGSLESDFSSATGILDCLVFGACPSYGVPYNEKTDDSEWSGKVGLDWFASPDILVYGHVSRGFKSGGFAGVPASTTAQYESYEPETLTAFELGFKATLADGAAQLNGSTFYYDYKDRQVLTLIPDPVFGPLTAYVNAPETEIYGVELELQWRLSEGLDIRQAIGYTKGEFKKFTDLDSPATFASFDSSSGLFGAVYKDRSGEDVPGSELQYSGVISYEWQLTDGIDSRVQLDYGYESEYSSLIGDDYELESRWLVNAQVSLIESNDNRWNVTLWGKNLGDKEYYTNKNFYNESFLTASVGEPRTYGLRATYNWM